MAGILIRDGRLFHPLGGRGSQGTQSQRGLYSSPSTPMPSSNRMRAVLGFALSEHGANQHRRRWLAKKENDADLIGGVNIAVKGPLSGAHAARPVADRHINDSMKLAQTCAERMSDINEPA